MERNGDNLFIETFDRHSNFYLFYGMGAYLSLDRFVNKKHETSPNLVRIRKTLIFSAEIIVEDVLGVGEQSGE
jgi:hypothetical protein